ncbi:DUF2062 domain-containing protein [Paracoccus caeni]|nr:DUF2062 domain-containing protein [Paracoccus caeni]
MIYPRGGWRRAGTYIVHRLSRLPDQPQRIALGLAVGVLASFTPFYGVHFLLAAALAWMIRGNIFAALIGTFAGNPVTLPFIAIMSVSLGRYLMGMEAGLPPQEIFVEFARASAEIWQNVAAIFGPAEVGWDRMGDFMGDIFLPYLIGGTFLGLIAGFISYYLALPVIRAYHRRRAKKMARRIAKAHAAAPIPPLTKTTTTQDPRGHA